tara:strand:+ start:7939 stop:8364 length:426 start_codon:yes stop_codon:yes gene_type:complete
MVKKILIMGLPGAGKTTLASKLVKKINARWLNADQVRKEANDFDFSMEGRKRQALRMANLAESFNKQGHKVIADFVCPTPEARKLFNPDYIIWLDTIKKGRFEDTNNIFVQPDKYDVKVTEKNADSWSSIIAQEIMIKEKL